MTSASLICGTLDVKTVLLGGEREVPAGRRHALRPGEDTALCGVQPKYRWDMPFPGLDGTLPAVRCDTCWGAAGL